MFPMGQEKQEQRSSTEAYCGCEGRTWESSQLQGRAPSLLDSASDGGPGGAGRIGMGLREEGRRGEKRKF